MSVNDSQQKMLGLILDLVDKFTRNDCFLNNFDNLQVGSVVPRATWKWLPTFSACFV